MKISDIINEHGLVPMYDTMKAYGMKRKTTNGQKHFVTEINIDSNTKKDDFSPSDLDEFIGRTKSAGKVNGYEIHLLDEDAPEEYIWLVKDPDSEGFLGYVSFTKGAYAGNDFYKSNVFFDESLQGKGLAVALYVFAIKKSGITLVSDKTQTQGSKSVWAKLAQQPGIHVYGWNVTEYVRLQRSGKNTDSTFFHWDPNTDLDDEIYVDPQKDEEEFIEIRKRMTQAAQEYAEGKISDAEYQELVRQYQQLGQDLNKNSVAGEGDIRLVATAEAGLGEAATSANNYGIPKGATLAQLDKIASTATGEKRERAHWLRNMRRGKNKSSK